MAPQSSENPNLAATARFVGAMARSGLTDVVICPGSRSTPLTLAFHAHPNIRTHIHLDERSGSFKALGLALATDRPVAIVCTSGTAGANFYPAVIEANMSQVPLIAITADRPPELRHSGANQTIDQVKLFGDHVLWAVDMDVPTAGIPDVALRNIETTGRRAFELANGTRKGPIHINWPFRKPFEGEVRFDEVSAPVTAERPIRMPGRSQIERLAQLIDQNERGLIVCGPRCPDGDFPEAVSRLAQAAGYPIMADPLSGLRFGPHVEAAPIFSSYESVFVNGREVDWEAPTLVIRFGAVPTSKWLNAYLDQIDPVARIHVRENGVWADDGHRTTEFWAVNESALCQFTQSMVAVNRSRSGWLDEVMATEATFWSRFEAEIEAYSSLDLSFVNALMGSLPNRANLVAGSSLPIRHIDQFARPALKSIRVFSNRGASGIDGVISTAVGVAAAGPDVPAVLLIGDVSFFHDLNGLLLARSLPNLSIVLLNNDGGSIFRRLPIAKQEPPFTELFLTPHGLDFEPVVKMHGLELERVDQVDAFRIALGLRLDAGRPGVIEVRTDGAADAAERAQLLKNILPNR